MLSQQLNLTKGQMYREIPTEYLSLNDRLGMNEADIRRSSEGKVLNPTVINDSIMQVLRDSDPSLIEDTEGQIIRDAFDCKMSENEELKINYTVVDGANFNPLQFYKNLTGIDYKPFGQIMKSEVIREAIAMRAKSGQQGVIFIKNIGSFDLSTRETIARISDPNLKVFLEMGYDDEMPEGGAQMLLNKVYEEDERKSEYYRSIHKKPEQKPAQTVQTPEPKEEEGIKIELN